MNQRLEQLSTWLTAHLGEHDLAPLAGDASFRRYFRAKKGNETFVIMDAPPERENCKPFIQVAELLRQASLSVPHILAQDLNQGFLLLSDLGDRLLLPHLSEQTADHLYHNALKALIRLQQIPASTSQLPQFDTAFMQQELQRVQEWYLPFVLNKSLNDTEKTVLTETFNFIINEVNRVPTAIIHRDYHSRNLFDLTHQDTGIIDFQDAMIGPVTYDVISLLRDCYIRWPEPQVQAGLLAYRNMALSAGVLPCCTEREFLRFCDMTSLQRHLKVVGIFARLHQRDGKSSYLRDIPRVLEYIATVTVRYPELNAFWNLWQRWHTGQ
jgi:aminoglycoside/choline kinase family phosphotransferase